MIARRGFTLVEQVVVGGLLSLVLAASAMVLQPCLVDWRVVQDQSDMQRGATIAAQRLRKDLQATSRRSVTVCTSPPAVAFLGCRADGGAVYDPLSGTPTWEHFVIYFLDTQNHVLYRKLWPGDGSSAVPPLPYTFPTTGAQKLTADELALVCATSNGSERPLASMVDAMAVQGAGSVVTVDLSLSVATRRGRQALAKRVVAAMRVE